MHAAKLTYTYDRQLGHTFVKFVPDMHLRLGLLGRDAYSVKFPIQCRAHIGERSGEPILVQHRHSPCSTCSVSLACSKAGATVALTPRVTARVVCLTESPMFGDLGNEDMACTLCCPLRVNAGALSCSGTSAFLQTEQIGPLYACAKSHVYKAGGAVRGKCQTQRRPIKTSLGREMVEYLR